MWVEEKFVCVRSHTCTRGWIGKGLERSEVMHSGTQPPTVARKMEAQSENVHVACTFLTRFGTDSYAQSVHINKISASELSRKFIKSALLVGEEVTAGNKLCQEEEEEDATRGIAQITGQAVVIAQQQKKSCILGMPNQAQQQPLVTQTTGGKKETHTHIRPWHIFSEN